MRMEVYERLTVLSALLVGAALFIFVQVGAQSHSAQAPPPHIHTHTHMHAHTHTHAHTRTHTHTHAHTHTRTHAHTHTHVHVHTHFKPILFILSRPLHVPSHGQLVFLSCWLPRTASLLDYDTVTHLHSRTLLNTHC
jgi:ABC-type nickel/cobalt efflux system permease component RcnA